MKRLCFSLVLAATLGLTAAAQTTLEACHAAAERNYPLVRQLDLIRRTRDYTLEEIRRGRLPQVQFTAQTRLQSDVTQIPIDLEALGMAGSNVPRLKRNQHSAVVDVTQSVYDGGRRKAELAQARQQAEADLREVESSRYALRQRVDALFFGLLLLDEELRLNGLLQDDLAVQASRLESWIRNGVAQAADLAAVEVEQLRARQQAAGYAATRQGYVEQLALLTGLPLDSTANLARPAWRPDDGLPSAEIRRPELRQYEAQIGLLQTQRERITAGLRPQLSLFAQGGYGRPGLDLFADRFELYGVVGARITWNLSAFYTRPAQLNRLRTNQAAVEARRDAFLTDTRQEAVRQQAEMARLRRLLAADDRIIALRTQIRQAAERKVAGGTLSGAELMRDVNAEQEASLDKALHEVQLLQAQARWKFTLNAYTP